MPGLGPGGGPAEPRRAPAARAAGTAGTGNAGTAGTGGAGAGRGNGNGSGIGRGGAGGKPLLREVPAQDPGAAEVGHEGGGSQRGGRAVFCGKGVPGELLKERCSILAFRPHENSISLGRLP